MVARFNSVVVPRFSLVVVAMFCTVVVHTGYHSNQSQLVGSTIKSVLTENYTQVFEPNTIGIELREK